MSKVHPLKTWPEFFEVVGTSKTFEVRKNDRNFQVGDTLWLQEYDPNSNEYTGRDKRFTVTYLLEGGQFGIEKGYCVMGLARQFHNQLEELLELLSKPKYMTSKEAEKIFR